MNTMGKAALGLVAASAVGLGLALSMAGTATGQATTASAASTTLTAAEQDSLRFSREEERMARDLYRQFADKYGSAPFSAITAAEQRHFDAVGRLLVTYSVKDPSAGANVGTYADSTLQSLYDGWKDKGLTSVSAAYQVGVALEKRDIADLQKLQAATSNPDLDRVYARLETGSQHHLAAFTAAAAGKPLPSAGGPGAHRAGMGTTGAGPGQRAGMGSGKRAGMGAGAGRGMGGRGGDCPLA